jgi:hypothetical protein
LSELRELLGQVGIRITRKQSLVLLEPILSNRVLGTFESAQHLTRLIV